MNTTALKLAAVALLPATLLAFSSCSSTPTTPNVQTTTTTAVQTGVPGGVTVETYTSSATVTALDAVARTVTVVSSNGATATFKAGPEVINFAQIKVGDQIRATLTRELVVFLRKPGEQPVDGETAAIALAPRGAKPGVVMANTVAVTAAVRHIDLKHHEVTLLFPDGTVRTVPVRSDVDLTKAKLGEQVVIRTTQAVALLVEKP